MSMRALLTGVVGGIIGTATAAFGIAWIFILNTFQTEIYFFAGQVSAFLSTISPGSIYRGVPFPFPIIPFFPSWSLFGLSSSILAILLIVTGILLGVGFYGTYKIGGGAMGAVGLVFGIIGITSGALLIIIGNLTTGYTYANMLVEMASVQVSIVPAPNFPVMWIGFIILGVTFIILGSASISVREMTMKPSVSLAAGIISIIGAAFFIIGSLWYILLTIGFGLIFVAFILWAVVFYSSRNM